MTQFLFMSIHCSEPIMFNDPWDANLYFESADDDFLKTTLGKESFPNGYFNNGVSPQIISIIKGHPEKELIEKRCFPPNTTAGHCYKLASGLSIGCLTSKWDDPLMWGHYSKGHLGFCVGVEFSDSYIDKSLFRVKYSNTIPFKIPFSPINQGTQKFIDYLIFDQLRTKSLNWSYEEEYRLIVDSKRTVAASPAIPELSAHLRQGPTPTYKIKELILGSKCDCEKEIFGQVRHSICAHATGKYNFSLSDGKKYGQDEIDDLIEESINRLNYFKVCGISNNYALIREPIKFPEEFLNRPLLPLPDTSLPEK